MTTRVSFYVLSEQGDGAREAFACRLVDKAWQQGLSVQVRCEDEAAVQGMDELLWRFSDRSFVPHEIAPAGEDPAPVLLAREPLPQPADLLVNLTADLPVDFIQHGRVVELVAGDETSKLVGRERYRRYREAGAELETFDLGRG
jgi:DNA polymerase-3 subunit chi